MWQRGAFCRHGSTTPSDGYSSHSAHILAMPSYHEGFCRPVAEGLRDRMRASRLRCLQSASYRCSAWFGGARRGCSVLLPQPYRKIWFVECPGRIGRDQQTASAAWIVAGPRLDEFSDLAHRHIASCAFETVRAAGSASVRSSSQATGSAPIHRGFHQAERPLVTDEMDGFTRHRWLPGTAAFR